MKPNVLFDLDGTLTDPQQGIIGCIRYALEKAGFEAPPANELLWCIGPPLHISFARLVPAIDEAGIQNLIALYRERFKPIGQFENSIYPGIAELLAKLQQRKRLYVATSKPHVFAKTIAEHFGFAKFFAGIHGSELDGTRTDKAELISFILTQRGIESNDAVIVGDRMHDILGAKKAGIRSIGVTWGYGSRKELEDAGADTIVESIAELETHLLG